MRYGFGVMKDEQRLMTKANAHWNGLLFESISSVERHFIAVAIEGYFVAALRFSYCNENGDQSKNDNAQLDTTKVSIGNL